MLDFTVLPAYAGYLLLMVAVVEAFTEAIKTALPRAVAARLGETDKRTLALLISVVLFLVMPLPDVNIVVNMIIAVVVSRGANCVHDFLKIIRSSVQD